MRERREGGHNTFGAIQGKKSRPAGAAKTVRDFAWIRSAVGRRMKTVGVGRITFVYLTLLD